MRSIFLLSLFAFSLVSFAQKSPAKFGDISMEEMTMKVYSKDSAASAVVLFDYGVAYLDFEITSLDAGQGKVQLYFERHTRIKILKKEGLGQSDIVVPLFHIGAVEEGISNLKAITYNLENSKIVATELSKQSIFKEDFNRNFNLFKLAMPNVKEGSVIEYSYKITSQFISNFPNWQFQRTIPVITSEYWAMIPEFFFFEKYTQGYVLLTNYTSEKTNYRGHLVTANHYVAKDVPAFKKEAYITSEGDYLSKINYALSYYQFPGQPAYDVMSSWEKLNERLLENENFALVISKSGLLKDEVEQIITEVNDPVIKIAAMVNYVKQNFEWNGIKDYLAFSLKKVIEKKRGSAADLNLLLGSMLVKAGFEVDMVLLSTRDHGFIRKSYPMERQFNYTICSVRVGDKFLLLDATEKYLPWDVLPARCLNGQGLRISKNYYGWINLSSKAKDRTFTSADFVLNENGKLDGKITYACDGYDGMNMRNNYFSKGEQAYAKEFLSNKQWTVAKTEFIDMKEFEKIAKASYEIIIDEHATTAGSVIYINPFVTSRIEENPFKSEKREYPVDYGNKIEKVYNCKIVIPDGFAIDELPISKVFAMPENGARFAYNVVQLDNAVNITSTFQINKPLFTQNEYLLLREFYHQVIAKQAEQIVLKKK